MKVPIQVRYSDFDMMGHLNNSAYATYFELARLNFLFKLFEEHSIEWTDVVANLTIDYRLPVYLESKPLVEIYCSRIGNSSYDLTYTMFEETNEEILYAEGKTIQVHVDKQSQKPVKIDTAIRNILQDTIKKSPS